jgi:hypothetical protein
MDRLSTDLLMDRMTSFHPAARGPSLIELGRSGVLGSRLVQVARAAAAMHRAASASELQHASPEAAR